MTKLNNLSLHDRLQVEGNLARFGLEGNKHMRGGLSVPDNAVVRLTRNTEDEGTHMVFQTNDLDQLKAWIGVPDSVFEDGQSNYDLPIPDVMKFNFKKCSCSLTTEESKAIYHAGRCYIWGPSKPVKEFKRTIESLFAPMEVVTHIYTTLDVRSTIIFDDLDQSVVIIANTINFYPNGKIESKGKNLTIYATNINNKSN